MSEEKITRTNVIPLWANKYPEVTRWLGKLQKKEANAWFLWRFCTWAKKSPTELIALKDNPADRSAEQLLDDFVDARTPEFTNPVKWNTVNAVKSFFKHNYRDLAKACGVFTLIQQREHKKPRKEDLKRLWDYAQNFRDKALITFVNSTALAKETMSELRWEHFEEDWERKDLPCINCPSEILKGHGVGRYRGVRQITFLTPEAKRDLLMYREWVEKKMGRKFTMKDRVWRNTYAPYDPISYNRMGDLIVELSHNAGVRFSWHDGRRVVETALEEVGIHPNWARKIRGRKVKGEEAPYSQPEIEKLRAKYREAVPLLQFTVAEEKDEREKLIENAVMQAISAGLPPSRAEEMRRLWRSVKASPEQMAKDIAQSVREAKKREEEAEQIKSKQQPKTDNNCPDGQNCQRVVVEDELPALLAQHWHVVCALPSGKIVVSNEM